MLVGNKIRKIRELKNITPKDMADRLDMSVPGYNKIERDEVTVNIDRLVEIAGIFEMKPEEVLTFDEKYIFHNTDNKGGNNGVNFGTFNSFPDEVKKLYEDKTQLLEDKVRLLEEKIKWLEEKLNKI